MTRDEARRIAANITKLPELLDDAMMRPGTVLAFRLYGAKGQREMGTLA